MKCDNEIELEEWEKNSDEKIYGWFCYKCGRPYERKYLQRLAQIQERKENIILDFEIKRSVKP